jgi:hypothetical protein
VTNKSPVPIAELPSPSALQSKNNLHPEAILMSPNGAQPAVQPESRIRLVAAAMEAEMGQHRGKCTR